MAWGDLSNKEKNTRIPENREKRRLIKSPIGTSDLKGFDSFAASVRDMLTTIYGAFSVHQYLTYLRYYSIAPYVKKAARSSRHG